MVVFIEGTAQLRELALSLEEAGNVTLRRAMFTNLRLAVEPIKPEITKSALDTLPRGGGANEWVASAPIGTSAYSNAKGAAVALRMKQPHKAKLASSARAKEAGKKFGGNLNHNLAAINKGILRHPLFGKRGEGAKWYTTHVRPGFFTRPCLEAAPEVTAAMVVVMEQTALVALAGAGVPIQRLAAGAS